VLDVAACSGIVLDPVYSGKALHCLLGRMREQPEAWRGKRVLFIHTGGLLVRVMLRLGHGGVKPIVLWSFEARGGPVQVLVCVCVVGVVEEEGVWQPGTRALGCGTKGSALISRSFPASSTALGANECTTVSGDGTGNYYSARVCKLCKYGVLMDSSGPREPLLLLLLLLQGMYDKLDQLQPLVELMGKSHRLKV